MIRNHKQSTLNCCRCSQIQNVALVFVPLVIDCGGLAREPHVMMPWDPRCHQGASEFGAEGWQGPAAVSTYPCLTLDNT